MPFWNRKSETQTKALRETVAAQNTQLAEMQEAYLDMRNMIYDHPSFAGGMMFGGRDEWLGGNLADIKDGKIDLLFMNEQELTQIRSISQVIADVAPGKGILTALTSYVMDTGWTYTIDAKNNVEVDEADIQLAQEVIDDFREENDWDCGLEIELFERSERHGEFIVSLWPRDDGTMKIRTVEPHQVKDPGTQPPDDQSWTFGVATNKDDTQTVHGYWIAWNDQERSKYVEAERIVHHKQNVPLVLKRGIGSFWFCFRELKKGGEVLGNTGASAAVQAAIAWIEKMAPGAKQSQVEDVNSLTRTMSQGKRIDGTRRSPTETVEGGTIRRVEKDREFVPSPASSSAISLIAIADALVRWAATTWNMPEYIASNNANNTVYASALVAESPFVKKCRVIQKKTAKPYREIFYRVLEHAAKHNRLGSIGPDRVRKVLDVSVEFPEVAARDADKDTNRRKILHEAGAMSLETWATQEDLDFKQEKHRGAKRVEQSLTTFGIQNPISATESRNWWEGYP